MTLRNRQITGARTCGARSSGLKAGNISEQAWTLICALSLLGGVCGSILWISPALARAVATVAALSAPQGVTAVSGQVLQLNGKPLAGVTLRIRDAVAVSDTSGRFLLSHHVPEGRQILRIEGSSADRPGKTYGEFEAGVNIIAGRTAVLPYKIWMPVLDTAHAVAIPSPTRREIVITNPRLPGLELHIPAGIVITDWYGRRVKRITITPIPVDRPPFPLPVGVRVPVYFTIQPGGAYLASVNGKYKGARLFYPNALHLPPGARYAFWSYDRNGAPGSWYIYGHGRVNPKGREVIPDRGVEIHAFAGAMVGSVSLAAVPGPPPDGGACAGDPVECSTGLLLESHTDFFLPDVIPIQLTRSYRTLDGQVRQYGRGQSDNYDIFLIGDGGPITYPTWAAVVLPDGAWVYFKATSSPGVLLCQENSGIFYASVLAEDSNTNLWSLTLKNGTILTFPVSYNAQNSLQAALIRIEDRFGNQLLIYRNASGAKTEIVSPHNRTLTFTYPNQSTMVVTDNFGRQVTYSFDSNDNLKTVTDAKGGVTTYSYTYNSTFLSFQLTSIKDPRGYYPVSNLQYDSCGRVYKETQADGGIWQFSYTPYSSSEPCYPIYQTTITDPRTDPHNYQKLLTFDSAGFVIGVVSAVGEPEQQATTINRDETYGTHLINSITDQLGRTTAYLYDGAGNVKSVTRLSGSSNPIVTSYTYEPTYYQLATVKDPLQHTWTIGYDSNHNPSSITDPLQHTSTLHIDPTTGLLSYVIDPANNETQFLYNGYGDLYQIIDPAGNLTYRNTDTVGRVTSIEDPLNNTTSFQYDNLDHLTQITDPKGGETQFGYDANENLTCVADALNYGACLPSPPPNTHATTYGYDQMNRRNSRTDALGKIESYQYDYNGNLTKYTDRNGHYVNYTYDGINRRSIANFQSGTDIINYGWDGGDRLCQASDSSGTITRQYGEACSLTGHNTTLASGLDFLTQEATPQGTVSYGTPDLAGRRTAMTVAGQNAVSYGYDNANRLIQISQSGTGTVSFGYDNADRRTLLTLPNSVTQAYVYDNGGQGDSHVTSITYKHGTTNIGNLTYGYDPDGRRTSVGGSLAAVNIAWYSGPNSFNADNELIQLGGPYPATLTYDNNGQLTSNEANGFTWDVRRHLTAISGASTGSFVYDALGRRASKTVNGVTIKFLYDGLNPVQELNATGAVVANMLTGLNMDEYLVRNEPGCCGPQSYLTDALGSTKALVSSSGTIDYQYEYDPFGITNGFDAMVSTTNSYQFTGRENDNAGFFGLYYYRGRYYIPALERFISQDPLDFAGGDTNLYAFVSNNPISLVDLLGLTSLVFDPGGGVLTVDPEQQGRTPYDIPATSGRPNCHCGSSTPNAGPIPNGDYQLDTREISQPNFLWNLFVRNNRLIGGADWGGWRVPLHPNPGTNTFGRSGFFLHEGYPGFGSAGCINVGGGLLGNTQTDQLLQDLRSDPDGIVPVHVK